MEPEFIRMAMLTGEAGVQRLGGCHIAVFGLGGVGSYAVEALARCGVGRLTLVDPDTVSRSNINRQLFALHSTIGQLKTEAARARVLDINPICRVDTIAAFYLPETADRFFTVHYDYIIDAVDTVSAKLDLAARAQALGIPIISAMGTGNKMDASQFEVADITQTQVCPLCRVMRRELKKKGVTHLKVVYSREAPIRPGSCREAGERPQTPGSIAFVPPVAGLLLAGEAIRELLKS